MFLTATLWAQPAIKVNHQKIISPNALYLISPCWSPDGLHIAAAGGNYGSIWLYTVATGQWRKLIEENGVGWEFDWSPDGKKIAFRSNMLAGRRKQTTIKIADIASGHAEQLIDYTRNISSPKWVTQDMVAFLIENRMVSFSASLKKQTSPATVPMGKNVCFISGDALMMLKNGQGTKTETPLGGMTFNASFSPDGSRLLFEKTGGKIYWQRVSDDSLKFIANGEMPAWSPDGKWIAYANPKDDGHQFISSDIFACDAGGERHFQLTDTADELEMHPYWSPDGRAIACDSEGKIILLNLETE